MAKKTNWKPKEGGKEYYKINRKVGMKLKDGVWVDDYKCFYGSCKSEAEQKYNEYMQSLQNNSISAATRAAPRMPAPAPRCCEGWSLWCWRGIFAS